MSDSLLVSIVVPMRNEAERIEALVDDIAAQDYPGPIEVLVADGRSNDDSVARLEIAARRRSLGLTVVDNPRLVTAAGLNECISRASGAIVVRMDCHARYAPGFVARCVTVLSETEAWCVGGPTRAAGQHPVQRAVACAMGSPFGGIGWAHGAEVRRGETDTVYGGAFWRRVFREIGLYDEAVGATEDEDLALRVRLAGGRVVVDPSIDCTYLPRESLREVARQYYRYGFSKPLVMAKHRRVVSLRSLAPLVFVGSLSILALAGVREARLRPLLAAELLAYTAAAAVSSIVAVRRSREPWSLVPVVAATFPTFHLGYGVGITCGFLRLARASGGRRRETAAF